MSILNKYLRFALLSSLLIAQILYVNSCATTSGGKVESISESGATVAIESITELEDRIVVLLKSQSPLNYTPYRLESPLRLVVDITNASFVDSGTNIVVDNGTIDEIKIFDMTSEGRTISRMEMYLLGETNYFISKPEDNQIKIEIQKIAGTYTESPAPVIDTSIKEEWKTPATRIINIVTDEDSLGTTVTVLTDGRVDDFESFVLDDPYRLVVDIKNLTSNFPKNEIKVGGTDIDDIRIGIHPDKVRLVFESAIMGGINTHKVYATENKLMVVFREGVETTYEKEGDISSPAPTTSPGSIVTITDVRFEDRSDVARVTISTSGRSDYNAKMLSDRSVIVDISNALIGEGLEKMIDTSAFRGPVSSISSYRTEEGGLYSVRIIVELNNKVAYRYFDQANEIVLDFDKTGEITEDSIAVGPETGSITPKITLDEGLAQPATLPGGTTTTVESTVVPPSEIEAEIAAAEEEEQTKYTGKKITLIFTDADIRNIFQLIAEVSNLNILVDSNVRGRITLRLVKVPWDQALDIILTTTGLGMKRVGNVIRIATTETLDRERTTELASKRALEELEDLVTRKIDLSYADLAAISDVVEPMLSDRGEITTFDQTQSLLITDIPSNLDPILKIIRSLDIPTSEIRLEARIVEINDTFEKELGVNWAFGYNNPTGGESYKTTVGTLESTLLNFPGGFDPTNLYFPATPETANLGPGGASALIGLVNDTMHIEVQLKALEQMGEAELIETPKIRVLNNVTASFKINRKVPIRNIKEETDEEGNVSTKSELDFQEFLTELEITPSVSADKRIKLVINLVHKTQGESRTLNISGVDNIYYVEDEKELNTEVLVDNRDTIVIGGLYRKDLSDTVTGFPLIKDIPVFGWLFKTKTKREVRKELLIFVTPTIIRESEEIKAEVGMQ